MLKKINNQKGVTLLILVIMIIVMLIIAGITIYSGTEAIQRAGLENLKTNLLLIEAKTKEYVEEVSFKMGTKPDESKRTEIRQEVYETEGKLVALSNTNQEVQNAASEIGLTTSDACYYVPRVALDNMGLNQVEEGNGKFYLVKFDETNLSVEVYNTEGYDDNGTIKYSLTDIDAIEY